MLEIFRHWTAVSGSAGKRPLRARDHRFRVVKTFLYARWLHPIECSTNSMGRRSKLLLLLARSRVLLDRRRAVGVEALDGFESPRLTLLAFRFRPDDRLPVGREDQA